MGAGRWRDFVGICGRLRPAFLATGIPRVHACVEIMIESPGFLAGKKNIYAGMKRDSGDKVRDAQQRERQPPKFLFG